jgi:hypothetical protein
MLNDAGTHAQLIQRNFVYNQLWNQQHAQRLALDLFQ